MGRGRTRQYPEGQIPQLAENWPYRMPANVFLMIVPSVKTCLHTVVTSTEELVCLVTTAAILLVDKDVAPCRSNVFKFPIQIFPKCNPNISLSLLYCTRFPFSSLEASLWSWLLLKISAAFAALLFHSFLSC